MKRTRSNATWTIDSRPRMRTTADSPIRDGATAYLDSNDDGRTHRPREPLSGHGVDFTRGRARGALKQPEDACDG